MAAEIIAKNADFAGFEHYRPKHSGEEVHSSGEESVRESDAIGEDRTLKKLTGSAIRSMIVEESFNSSVSDDDRFRMLGDDRAAAIVIQIPEKAWIGAVKRHIEEVGHGWVIIARDGGSREHNPTHGKSEVANDLATGRTVVGIATDPDMHLPATLTAAADVRIVLANPDGTLLTRVMRAFFADDSVVGDDVLAALDLDDIVAAMRAGTTSIDAIDRLRRASRNRLAGDLTSGVPVLANAIEFGEARDFGLALAKDIVDYKIGKLSWSEAMKGGLFYGYHGTGKSLLCASIAQAAGVPLLRFSPGSFFDKNSHLGTVVSALREAFVTAGAMAGGESSGNGSRNAVVVVFEEVEGIIPRRDQLEPRGRDWWIPIINLALTLFDAGLTTYSSGNGRAGMGRPYGIFLLATTNHAELVEPALLRAGRLEKAIEVKRPDLAGLENILRFHLGDDLVGDDIRGIARRIEGVTAAECMAVVREARRSARVAGRAMQIDDLQNATRADDDDSEILTWRIAVHEAGHAVSTIVTGCGTLETVSIRGRGTSGGQTVVTPDATDLPTLASVELDAVTYLAAGAAEEAIVGSLSTGWARRAFSDLGKVSRQLAMLHASSGLIGSLLMRADGDEAALAVVRSDPVLRAAVEQHMQRLHGRARDLVERHRDRIIAVAKALTVRRHLDAVDVVEILAAVPQTDEMEPGPRQPGLVRVVSSEHDENRTPAEAAPG